MTRRIPPLSTDQVLAFVEFARMGSFQAAAQNLHLSSEGLRGRILALEDSLGQDLYEKERGRRGDVALTAAGRRFLQRAMRFLDQAHELTRLFEPTAEAREIQLIASHYLMAYVLLDAVRLFHARHPEVRVRLSTRAEAQILGILNNDPTRTIGACTPTEFPRGLHYRPWRSVGWKLVVPRSHRWAAAESVRLADIANEPLIVFERGSAGRMHVLETFHALGIEPNIVLEATSTPLIVRMVNAGLGVAVIPLDSSGAVAQALDVATVALADTMRPIETGLYLRAEWVSDEITQDLLNAILDCHPPADNPAWQSDHYPQPVRHQNTEFS